MCVGIGSRRPAAVDGASSGPAYGEQVTNRDDELAVLHRGLDQATSLLGSVGDDDLTNPTPCQDWTTAELVGHLAAAPGRFARMLRGEEVDWGVKDPEAGSRGAATFRTGADDLLDAWGAVGDADAPMGPDWQTAEVAVHTYDLATALGRPTADLDVEVAERALAFMQANLTQENRGGAFRPEQSVPDGADAYQRLAAFAGRTVTSSR
jgi:uncharacterized protein (TIGR03086 family)